MLPNTDNFEQIPLCKNLNENIESIKRILGGSSDLLTNPVKISGISCAVICFEGMTSGYDAELTVIHPLIGLGGFSSGQALFDHISQKMVLSVDSGEQNLFGNIIRLLMSGFVILLIEGVDKALFFGIQGYESRGVSEPSSEGNIRGSHEGFTEKVRTNMSMIRRRLKSPQLRFKLFPVSRRSQTDVIICFMADRVPTALVKSIEEKLKKLPLETVLGSGYVSPFLDSGSPSLFSGITLTERPDVMCAKLLEGRVGVIIDGTPFALVLPCMFTEHFQTLDDYNFRPFYAVLLRYVRYIAFFLAVFLPGLYVGVALFHPEMISSRLLFNLAAAEEAAPLHLMAEAVIILVFYEIIREAGVRLPKSVGGAVSIVGGLIIGDAAVNAGIISNPVLLACAISVTASFVIPSLDQQVTVFRLAAVIAGGLAGIFGISLLSALMLANVCAAECYGLPIMAPLSPFSPKAMGDTAIRLGFRRMGRRGFTIESLEGAYIGEAAEKELENAPENSSGSDDR